MVSKSPNNSIHQDFEAMASNTQVYAIKGIQDGLDPDKHQLLRKVPVRMELDDWYLSEELVHINQRALFFPALWKFSQMDPHEKLSWFQIAGESEVDSCFLLVLLTK